MIFFASFSALIARVFCIGETFKNVVVIIITVKTTLGLLPVLSLLYLVNKRKNSEQNVYGDYGIGDFPLYISLINVSSAALDVFVQVLNHKPLHDIF